MFDMFKKRKLVSQNSKEMEQLQHEFEQEQKKYILMANSDVFKFFKEYFEAKIELNRDRLELLDKGNEERLLKAENKVMREFVSDIESMQQLSEVEEVFK